MADEFPYRVAAEREEYTATQVLESVRAQLDGLFAENARLTARIEVVDNSNVQLATRLTRCVSALEAIAASEVSDAVRRVALAALEGF